MNRRSERGATAVMVALLLMGLFGFAALAVDVGALWSDRKQVQNGADAAALAVAQICAAGPCSAGERLATAEALATPNKNDSNVAVASVAFNSSDKKVTVTLTTQRSHWFAQLIGAGSSTTVTASATAAWSSPGSGTTLPLTVSVCAFQAQTGSTEGTPPPTTQEFTLDLMTQQNAKSGLWNGNCTGLTGNGTEVPGGFGWLDSTSCVATIGVGGQVGSDPGVSASNGCPADQVIAAVTADPVVLVPLYETYSTDQNGQKATYTIDRFAAFQITAICFPGSFKWNCNDSSGKYIRGRFVSYVTVDDAANWTGSAPSNGVYVVRLTA